jgi:hypothetical protein
MRWWRTGDALRGVKDRLLEIYDTEADMSAEYMMRCELLLWEDALICTAGLRVRLRIKKNIVELQKRLNEFDEKPKRRNYVKSVAGVPTPTPTPTPVPGDPPVLCG